MVDLIDIRSGSARLVLVPEMGGGIARLDVDGLPVLRPWEGDHNDLFSLACNVLVPFSNRISGGGFNWNNTAYKVSPNLSGEPFPIHGDGFQKAWDVEQDDKTAKLTLNDGGIGPWKYQATQEFQLSDNSLLIVMNVTNKSEHALPFGGGFHPWFSRSDDTRLSFQAESVWLEDKQYLPSEKVELANAPEWSFEEPRPLPQNWINNGYNGWTGPAQVSQGADAVSCRISASKNLSTALVFSPENNAPFFCFEPVSHPVDAFHLEGHPSLVELSTGETMITQMKISWDI